MILSSFTVIFTSVFQSNIELWIHFFLFCGQIQLQVWRKCFSKEKTHCDERKQVLFHPLKVFYRKLHHLRNIVMMQDLLWTHQNLSFQNTVSFVGQDDKRIFSTHGKFLSFSARRAHFFTKRSIFPLMYIEKSLMYVEKSLVFDVCRKVLFCDYS